MKNWKYLLLITVSLSQFVFADSMKSNFDEGRAYGSSINGNVQGVMKDFNANQIMPNAGSPKEANLYTGQNSNPNLGAMGIQALSDSEVGTVLNKSLTNNPMDNISPESEMMKRSDEIVQNADYLTGGITGNKCIKQSLSKSHFTNHFCEKDQNITKVCKTTAEVLWKGARKKAEVPKELHLNVDDMEIIAHPKSWLSKSRIFYKYRMPYDAILTGSDFYFRNSIGVLGLGRTIVITPNQTIHEMNAANNQPHTLSERGMALHLKKGDEITFEFKQVAHWLHVYISKKMVENHIKLYLLVEEDVNDLTYEVVYKNSCSESEMDNHHENAVKLSEQCLSNDKTRTFEKDGKLFNINAECWDKNEVYAISDASDNECKKYDDNPNCTVGERQCLSYLGDSCTRFRLKYQCQHITKTDGVVCGDKFFCSDGSCADLEGSQNADFGHAISQLASLAQAGKDIGLDAQNLRAFSGRPMACRKSGFGFSDCCKDSGWGHKAGIAHCSSEENLLGRAKEKNTAIYVGTYCSKKVLKHCVQRKSSYCVFDSKLARIIQYQGRSGQLGVGFGGAKNPDCRGLTVDELQRLNFNSMDYSDFYSELQENTKIPNQDKIVDFIQKNIAGQLQQKQ